MIEFVTFRSAQLRTPENLILMFVLKITKDLN